MTDGITQATIAENGASPYAVSITVSGHALSGDEPISFGGGDTGPAPYDLLTASLGECTAMTVRWYAKQQNWPLSSRSRASPLRLADSAHPVGRLVVDPNELLVDAK